MIYFLTFLAILFLSFIIKLLVIKQNIIKLENEIIIAFEARTNVIPAVFDVTKSSFSKHSEVFEEILKYRDKSLYKYSSNIKRNYDENDFIKIIHLEQFIHHELNFIFKVAEKHPKLSKKWKFIYLRELLINRSYEISKLFEIYKTKVVIFNYLIDIKKLTIIWALFPISKKLVV